MAEEDIDLRGNPVDVFEKVWLSGHPGFIERNRAALDEARRKCEEPALADYPNAQGPATRWDEPCPRCNGKGGWWAEVEKTVGFSCLECGGSGRRETQEGRELLEFLKHR